MATFEGAFLMETTYSWETINEKTTRMTLQNKGEPSGFSKVFAFMMSRMMRKANHKDLRSIKTILESH